MGEITRTYLNEIGGGFKLNHDGEKEVRAILAQIEDGNIGSGNKYWERNGTASGKRQRFNKEDKIKIQEWALEAVDIGSLNIRDIHRAKDYALVSLWLLTVHLNKVQAVRSNDAYYYFKEKFKTISVKAETFKEALFKPSNSRYFRKTEDSFFLTSEGQQIVEAWTTGAPIGASDISEDEVVS